LLNCTWTCKHLYILLGLILLAQKYVGRRVIVLQFVTDGLL